MQPTSCLAERSFSGLRRILRWDRASLNGYTVKEIATVRNNWNLISSLQSVTRLTESEARAQGVGHRLLLHDCLEAEDGESAMEDVGCEREGEVVGQEASD